jgi:hypothetical protein
MQQCQLTRDEIGISLVAGPCSGIYDIQARVDQSSDFGNLLQLKSRGRGLSRDGELVARLTAWRWQRSETQVNIAFGDV